ncbi:MAG: transcription termination/antitermination protein NusA [Clostridia bacterium]|nr:transcription termination/antitermination protein NusA [Clostridia bacterium]
MNAKLFEALNELEAVKGIPVDYMLEKIEGALVKSIQREIGETVRVRVVLDPVKRDMKVYQQREVVEVVTDPVCEISLEDAKTISKRHKIGSIVETKLAPDTFRRLSATAGKQILIQAIREAERNNMARAYENKKEKLITATVFKVDDLSGDLTLETPDGRVRLPRSLQLPDDAFEVGDRLQVYVSEVRSVDTRGPIVDLSRIHPGFVKCLFEKEIPEIADGTVIIAGIAREAGSRTKIAVYSEDPNVDPIGACIGNRGMRINAILDELGGHEKIDIIRYHEDPAEYIREALSPAEVLGVTIDGERSSRVTVAQNQLSLAIGKEGQNAKLAARLTGYKIDIKA